MATRHASKSAIAWANGLQFERNRDQTVVYLVIIVAIIALPSIVRTDNVSTSAGPLATTMQEKFAFFRPYRITFRGFSVDL